MGSDGSLEESSTAAKTYQRCGYWLSEYEIQTPERLVCKPDVHLTHMRAVGSNAFAGERVNLWRACP